MLDSLTATRFDRLMIKGRTGPFLLECEHATQGSVEVVAKFTGPQLTVEGLMREALCAMLAADLGLPVPPCFCVAVEPDFVAALAAVHPDAAAFLAKAVPVGFGSAKLPPGYATWMPGRSIPKGMQASAAEIYAFDLLVQNPDRRPDNPNLEAKGETFAIFDHEMALVTEGVLFRRPPWEPGALAASGAPDRHILRPRLRGTAPDLARLIGAWEAIDDGRLTAYGNAIPPQWTAESAGGSDYGNRPGLPARPARPSQARHARDHEDTGMSTKTPYSFTVLRYVHDIATGEFLNVGVALLAPEHRYVNALCRTTFQRLKTVFPTLDGESFRASMRHVTHEFERLHQQLRDQLPLRDHGAGVMGYAHSVLGADDSSLQWSPMGAGVTVDRERTLEQA